MPIIECMHDDITTMAVDAIVNAANSSLLGGGGVDGAIHRKGGKLILEQCQQIRAQQGGCKTGEAVVTTAGNLAAKYVIHTVGPVWQGGQNQEAEQLAQCYYTSLKLAAKLGCKSVAFPNISTGTYHFPKDKAAQIAVSTVQQALEDFTDIEQVCFVCFDEENFLIYQDLLSV